jgi:peptidoglycan/xylan/chitin deacetylase (PgdA/CDA1 family)
MIANCPMCSAFCKNAAASSEDSPILRVIPNKREFLAKSLGRLGVLWALEHSAAVQKPGLTVLTYHRIGDPGTNLFYDPVISATPDAFEAQIKWLCSHFKLLTVGELAERIHTGSPWREPTALVTFDDGYRDNFEVAIPILQKHDVPATFFIPTSFLDSPELPWWDLVAYVVKQTQVRRFVVETVCGDSVSSLEINLQTMSRTAAIMKIIRALLDEAVDDERRFLDRLAVCAQVAVDAPALGGSLFMSWPQLRQLAGLDTRLTIGSHSVSHRNLARLDDDSQHGEVARSKHVLEAQLGREIRAFAYPYGWPGTYTHRTKAIVAEAGYRLAFTSREGTDRFENFDPWEISRLGVGTGDSPALLRARAALYAAFGRSFL